MYSAFISIVLVLIILAGWTFFAFISQPTKSDELINVIQDMYKSQKSVIVDVVDLSKLLIKDKSVKIASEDNILLNESESELLGDQEDKSLLDEQSFPEDNGDNPLGIVIEPSSHEFSEEIAPEIIVRPFDKDQNKAFRNGMESGIDMN
tara:strand:+ start:381 stop:827 length:447 start_codon:yes stop_codon:yes gene_type:complete